MSHVCPGSWQPALLHTTLEEVGGFSFKSSLPHSQPLSSGFVDSKAVREENVPPDSEKLGHKCPSALIPLSNLGDSLPLPGLSFPISQMGSAGSGDFEVLPARLGLPHCMPCCLADLRCILDSLEDSQAGIPAPTLHLLVLDQVCHGNDVVVMCVFPKTLVRLLS